MSSNGQTQLYLCGSGLHGDGICSQLSVVSSMISFKKMFFGSFCWLDLLYWILKVEQTRGLAHLWTQTYRCFWSSCLGRRHIHICSEIFEAQVEVLWIWWTFLHLTYHTCPSHTGYHPPSSLTLHTAECYLLCWHYLLRLTAKYWRRHLWEIHSQH